MPFSSYGSYMGQNDSNGQLLPLPGRPDYDEKKRQQQVLPEEALPLPQPITWQEAVGAPEKPKPKVLSWDEAVKGAPIPGGREPPSKHAPSTQPTAAPMKDALQRAAEGRQEFVNKYAAFAKMSKADPEELARQKKLEDERIANAPDMSLSQKARNMAGRITTGMGAKLMGGAAMVQSLPGDTAKEMLKYYDKEAYKTLQTPAGKKALEKARGKWLGLGQVFLGSTEENIQNLESTRSWLQMLHEQELPLSREAVKADIEGKWYKSPSWIVETGGETAADFAGMIGTAAALGPEAGLAWASMSSATSARNSAYDKLKLRDDLTEEQKRTRAAGIGLATGAVTAITEKVPLGYFTVNKELGQAVARKTMLKLAGEKAFTSLKAGTAEGLQEATEETAERAANYVIGGDSHAFDGYKEGVEKSAFLGFLTGSLAHGGKSAIEMPGDYLQVKSNRARSINAEVQRIVHEDGGRKRLEALVAKKKPSRKDFEIAGFNKDLRLKAGERAKIAAFYRYDAMAKWAEDATKKMTADEAAQKAVVKDILMQKDLSDATKATTEANIGQQAASIPEAAMSQKTYKPGDQINSPEGPRIVPLFSESVFPEDAAAAQETARRLENEYALQKLGMRTPPPPRGLAITDTPELASAADPGNSFIDRMTAINKLIRSGARSGEVVLEVSRWIKESGRDVTDEDRRVLETAGRQGLPNLEEISKTQAEVAAQAQAMESSASLLEDPRDSFYIAESVIDEKAPVAIKTKKTVPVKTVTLPGGKKISAPVGINAFTPQLAPLDIAGQEINNIYDRVLRASQEPDIPYQERNVLDSMLVSLRYGSMPSLRKFRRNYPDIPLELVKSVAKKYNIKFVSLKDYDLLNEEMYQKLATNFAWKPLSAREQALSKAKTLPDSVVFSRDGDQDYSTIEDEMQNAKLSAKTRILPKFVQRWIGSNRDFTSIQHNGVFTNPDDVASIYEDLNTENADTTRKYLLTPNHKAKIMQVFIGRRGANYRVHSNSTGQSIVLSVLPLKVAQDLIHNSPNDVLLEKAEKLGLKMESTKAEAERIGIMNIKHEAIVDAIGAEIARNAGFDAVWAPNVFDSGDASEYVGLTNNAFMETKDIAVDANTPVGIVDIAAQGQADLAGTLTKMQNSVANMSRLQNQARTKPLETLDVPKGPQPDGRRARRWSVDPARRAYYAQRRSERFQKRFGLGNDTGPPPATSEQKAALPSVSDMRAAADAANRAAQSQEQVAEFMLRQRSPEEIKVPKYVKRWQDPETNLTPEQKAAGLYTSPESFDESYKDYRGKRTDSRANVKRRYEVNPAAKVLVLGRESTSNNPAWDAIDHFEGDGSSAELLTADGARWIADAMVEAEAATEDDFVGKTDGQVAEMYGAWLAREQGYDAIWSAHTLNEDRSQYVGLTNNAFMETKGMVEEPRVPLDDDSKQSAIANAIAEERAKTLQDVAGEQTATQQVEATEEDVLKGIFLEADAKNRTETPDTIQSDAQRALLEMKIANEDLQDSGLPAFPEAAISKSEAKSNLAAWEEEGELIEEPEEGDEELEAAAAYATENIPDGEIVGADELSEEEFKQLAEVISGMDEELPENVIDELKDEDLTFKAAQKKSKKAAIKAQTKPDPASSAAEKSDTEKEIIGLQKAIDESEARTTNIKEDAEVVLKEHAPDKIGMAFVAEAINDAFGTGSEFGVLDLQKFLGNIHLPLLLKAVSNLSDAGALGEMEGKYYLEPNYRDVAGLPDIVAGEKGSFIPRAIMNFLAGEKTPEYGGRDAVSFMNSWPGRKLRAAGKAVLAGMRSRGRLDQRMFNAKLAKEFAINAELKRADFAIQDLEKALREDFSIGSLEEISPRLLNRLNMILSPNQEAGQFAVRREFADVAHLLPSKTRDAARKLRDHIDSLSQTLIDHGMLEDPLLVKIVENQGIYFNRSYKAFSDPEWDAKVSSVVRNRYAHFLRRKFPTMTDSQISNEIAAVLQAAKEAGGLFELISGGRLGSINTESLKQRLDLPSELRELLGENHDVRVNYLNSVVKTSRMIAQHKMLSDFRRIGLRNGLIFDPSDENIPEWASSTFETQGTHIHNPLAGLRMAPELKAALTQSHQHNKNPNLTVRALGLLMKAEGVAQVAKTALSTSAQVRQYWGNYLMSVANGNGIGAIANSPKSFKEAFSDVFGTNDESVQEKLLEAYRHGIAGESMTANMIMHAIQSDLFRDMMSELGAPSEAMKKAGKSLKIPHKMYEATDTVFKMMNWKAEQAKYREAFPEWSDAKLKAYTAEITRNLNPTYSMIPSAITMLRPTPFALFASFPMENVRNTYHRISLALTEIKNPRTRSIGMRRIAGMMTADALPKAVAWAGALAFGAPDDDDVREHVAPWDKFSDLLSIGRDKDNNPRYISMSYIDPLSYQHEILNALVAKGDWEAKLKNAFLQSIQPIANPKLVSTFLVEVAANKDFRTGFDLVNPELPLTDRLWETVKKGYFKAFEPGVGRTARGMYKGLKGEQSGGGKVYSFWEELAAGAFGIRITTINAKDSTKYATQKYMRHVQNDNRMVRRALNNSGRVSSGKIRTQYKKTEQARRANFDKLVTKVRAMRHIYPEMTDKEVFEQLKAANLGAGAAKDIMDGHYRPYVPGDMAGLIRLRDAMPKQDQESLTQEIQTRVGSLANSASGPGSTERSAGTAQAAQRKLTDLNISRDGQAAALFMYWKRADEKKFNQKYSRPLPPSFRIKLTPARIQRLIRLGYSSDAIKDVYEKYISKGATK